MMSDKTIELLGDKADDLLGFVCKGIPKESLHLPGPDHIDRVWIPSDRNPKVLRSLQTLFDHGLALMVKPAVSQKDAPFTFCPPSDGTGIADLKGGRINLSGEHLERGLAGHNFRGIQQADSHGGGQTHRLVSN